MALFQSKLPAKFKQAIAWFNKLSPEKQASLIVEFFKDHEKIPEKEAKPLLQIVFEIATALASHNKNDVTKRLVKTGIDDTLARIMVDKINTLKPTALICAEALKKLPDNVFKKVINTIATDFFLDWRRYNQAKISKKLSVDENIIRSAMILMRDNIVWEHLRGHLSVQGLQEKFSKEYGYSSAKVDILVKVLTNYRDELRFSLMFGTIQDMSREVSNLTKSNTEVLSTLKELIQLLTKEGKAQYIS